MARLWRNPEFKAIARMLLLTFILLAAAMLGLAILFMNTLQDKVVEQASAMMGKAIAAHPELEADIVSAVIVPAAAEDVRRGREALANRGYDVAVPVGIDPILSRFYPFAIVAALGVAVLGATIVFAVSSIGYSGIYRKVRRISDAAEKAVDGDYTMHLPAGGEGDFEILGHRINQMANRLRLNVEQLMAEKIFLKNTISDISHQLKTPLSTLVVYNDLMLDNIAMEPAQRQEFLVLGRQQLHRLEWLIQSLLKMARLEAGSIQFKREPVMLRAVADEAALALGAMADEAGVIVTIAENHPDACYQGDGAWLAEAAINILKNAIEHSKPGGAVEITLDQTALTASMLIADHGEGIDSGDLPHIFERFYRSASTVKPNSIGIGLAMAKAIVDGQGGSITVRSRKGHGSEFLIVFLKTLGE